MPLPVKVTVVSAHPGTSFRLAAELHRRGALERLISTHPPLRSEQIPSHLIRWNPWPEILMRSGLPNGHYLKALTFGRWAARHVGEEDLLICWAQFGLESIRKARDLGVPSVLVRQSTHILSQLATLKLPRTPLVDRELIEYQESTFVEVPTRVVKETFLENGFPENKLIVVPPVGVDPAVFHPPESGNSSYSRIGVFQALIVGVSERKGTRLALEACWRAGIGVWVVGRPENRSWWQKSTEHGHSVKFLGPLPQRKLAELYRRASAVIVASLEEGLPHVLVESLTSGCVVIASRESGASEIIQHSREGWLVNPWDVGMMAEYLYRLKHDKSLMARMSTAASETGRKWVWGKYGERAFAAYQHILTKKPTAGTQQ